MPKQPMPMQLMPGPPHPVATPLGVGTMGPPPPHGSSLGSTGTFTGQNFNGGVGIQCSPAPWHNDQQLYNGSGVGIQSPTQQLFSGGVQCYSGLEPSQQLFLPGGDGNGIIIHPSPGHPGPAPTYSNIEGIIVGFGLVGGNFYMADRLFCLAIDEWFVIDTEALLTQGGPGTAKQLADYDTAARGVIMFIKKERT